MRLLAWIREIWTGLSLYPSDERVFLELKRPALVLAPPP